MCKLHPWTALQGPEVDEHGAYAPSAIDALAPLPAELVSEEATRDALRELYGRCAWHPDSAKVWGLYMHFEFGLLANDKSSTQLETVRAAYVARLDVPHANLNDIFTQFSSFVSENYRADEYEGVMSNANKHYAAAQRLWEARESYEHSLATYDDWSRYLAWQGYQVKTTRTSRDKSALSSLEELGNTLYRRALYALGEYPLAQSADDDAPLAVPPTPEHEKELKKAKGRKSTKAREKELEQAKIALRERLAPIESIWLDYCALVDAPKADAVAVLDVCRSAVRALPSSGRLWAVYIRSLVKFQQSKAQVEQVYDLAVNGGVVAEVGGASSYVALLQANVDAVRTFETRDAASEAGVPPSDVVLVADLDRFMRVYEALVSAIAAAGQLSDRDASLTLERQTVDWVERAIRALHAAGPEAAEGLFPLADSIWDGALTSQPDNATAHLEAALYWKRRDDDRRARLIFRSAAHSKSIEDRVPILDAWVQFEHERGDVGDIQHAEQRAKVEKERIWRQWYKKYQAQAATQAVSDAVYVQAPDVAETAEPMDTGELQTKRKHEEETPVDDEAETKRSRTEQPEPPRDREYSAVIVSNLPADVSEGEIRSFFRECGVIYEINGPRQVTDAAAESGATCAALVEFTDREAASSALTRTLKRIHDAQVVVSKSYQCTLYVTNFPPDTDDDGIRERFGKYGPIFDVRWPSRRFMQSRRFCYVQYTQPEAANAALQEHGAHWNGEHPLQVFISNPAHKKARSDADANQKELFVSGLPRSITADEVREFFAAHAPVVDVRLPERPDGKSRGIAFVDFSSALDARRAMQATNSTKLKGRLIAVVLADAGRSRTAPTSDPEWRSRSVRVVGLPPDAQEALIQQAVEKATGSGSVRRVFWTPGAEGVRDALVELSDASTAGRAVLAADATYGEHPLTFAAYTPNEHTNRPTRGRGRGRGRGGFSGLGHSHSHTSTTPKGQDDFRAMLNIKK
ncbi:Splicing factor [Malassezia cuniculi]|uniref:U4/U6 snRNA-associated-splicing factor PRP24 n=1 Tax=Malassezia cuniculi TaxID=948313 RepID=A0AAF0EWI5_9BASI|nr:Splicing factor [Malassezia cuniculi]